MTDEVQRQRFAQWLVDQLRQRAWTQGKLILQSGSADEERLSSAAVSRYSTGKMLPNVTSCQKIARALGLPIALVLVKAGLIEPPSQENDWVQQVLDALVHAVDAGQLSEEGRLAIMAQIRREEHLQELERALANLEQAAASNLPGHSHFEQR